VIHSLWSYLKGEAWLRRRELITDSQLYTAIAVAVLAAWLGDGGNLGKVDLGDLALAVLTYAAIAFGFCLAALTLAITLPDNRFTTLLATRELPRQVRPGALGSRGRRRERMHAREKPPDAYSDLLFVFSWTAFAHWLAIAWGIGLLVACGGAGDFIPSDAPIDQRITAGILIFLLTYAALQFLVSLITVASLGGVYVGHLRNRQMQDEPSEIGPKENDAN
jgi:hypothetical protein